MIIEKNRVGVIAYVLHVDNAKGQLLEEATLSQPKTMLFGIGRVMQSFENKLLGLRSGDSFEFNLLPSESFGEFVNELLVEVPKAVFTTNGLLQDDVLEIGKTVPMMDEDGNPFDGRVLAINDKTVSMDFNHPLAGKGIYVKGEVLNVREATYEELNPVASGCGCGSHDDGCCGGGSGVHHHHHDHGHEGCGCGSGNEAQHRHGGCGCH